MKKISVLGSTGSIGTQTLDVVRKHREHFQIEGLGAGSNKDLLLQQVKEFSPRKVSVATKELADSIRQDLPAGTEVFHGHEGLIEIAARQMRKWWLQRLLEAWVCPLRLRRLMREDHWARE